MTTRILFSALGASALALLANGARAHGGVYRGPADIVPPSPGPGVPGRGPAGPTTGGGTGPSAPVPSPLGGGSGPTTGGGSGPNPGGGMGPRTGGMPVDMVDFSSWEFWWEFNKDSFLNLKDAVHDAGPTTGSDGMYLGGIRFAEKDTLAPTRAQLQNELLPALHRAIEATDQRDIASSCMIAMAKIGQDHPSFALVDVFRQRLQRPDQEIRETAALAMGIAAVVQHGEVDLLTSLARDDRAGRAAMGGTVDTRTRSFALHALGLVAHEHKTPALQETVFATMQEVLADRGLNNRNLKVAAISSLGLLNLDRSDERGRALHMQAMTALAEYFARDLGAGEQLIQAHCPTAIARLLDRDDPDGQTWKEHFAAELEARSPRRRGGADLHRSCVLALGQLCSAHEDDRSSDARYSLLLADVFANHRDAQTRNFAVLALGQIGGKANRTWLLTRLPKVKKAVERPWFALALGVMTHFDRVARIRQGVDGEDRSVGRALLEELQTANEPGLVGALGVALGLCRHLDAAPVMLQMALGDPQKEQQAGYLVLGLGLMRDRSAIEPLGGLIRSCSRRPDLLKQAATSLGLLGDRRVADLLRSKLEAEEGNLAAFAALSSALGLIGDRRSIQPLLALLFDERRGALTRAFAAAALGSIADRAPLPWHAKIAANLNYRAAVETLTDGRSGILDIL